MLDADKLNYCMDICTVHRELTESILRDIIRRFLKCDYTVSDTAAFQAERLQEAGMLYSDITDEIQRESKRQKKEIEEAFLQTETEVFDYDSAVLEAVGINPVKFKTLSPAMLKIYKAALSKSIKNAHGLTGTTATTSQTSFINACDLAFMQVSSGAFSYQQAIKSGILQAAEMGVTVLYPSGHISSLDNAMRSNVLTGISSMAADITEMRAEELGCDIMELSAHWGARPDHADWQGKLVSRSGREGYLSLSDIGYGEVTGFKGSHCRHDWFIFFEGASERAYTDEELDELKNAMVTYQGEEIPVWKAIEKQRAKERSIKKTKRQLVCLDEAAKNITDPAVRLDIQAEFEKRSVTLKKKEQALKEFCEETGLKHDSFRVQQFAVDTENGIRGFGKSVSQKAVVSFERKKLPNYKKAVFTDDKFTHYSLDMTHPTGKNKAIAFQKYLGYNINNKEALISELREGLKTNIATQRNMTQYGQPFEVIMNIKGANGKYAKVKTGWIIDNGAEFPRLTSVYVKE